MADGPYAAYARDLVRLREARDLTQQELADMSGVSKSTIQNLESGRTKPQRRVRDALNKTLNIDLSPWREHATSSPDDALVDAIAFIARRYAEMSTVDQRIELLSLLNQFQADHELARNAVIETPPDAH